MTDKCIECVSAIRKEKVWWVCRKNCVHRNEMDVCILNPVMFERALPTQPQPMLKYIYRVKKPGFTCITRRELAFKDFEGVVGQTWSSRNIPVETGDEIRIYGPGSGISEHDEAINKVIEIINRYTPEMEGKKLRITILELCQQLDKLRNVGE